MMVKGMDHKKAAAMADLCPELKCACAKVLGDDVHFMLIAQGAGDEIIYSAGNLTLEEGVAMLNAMLKGVNKGNIEQHAVGNA